MSNELPNLISERDLADQLHLSRSMLGALRRKRLIAFFRIGGRVHYATEDVISFLYLHRQPAAKPNFTRQQAADLLGVKVTAIDHMRKTGKLRSLLKQDVLDLVEKRKKDKPAPQPQGAAAPST